MFHKVLAHMYFAESDSSVIGPIGPLFRELSDEKLLLSVAEKLWAYIKELIVRSSLVIYYKIEPDIVLH